MTLTAKVSCGCKRTRWRGGELYMCEECWLRVPLAERVAIWTHEQADLALIEVSPVALHSWRGRQHPVDHIAAITCQWTPDEFHDGYYKSADASTPSKLAHVQPLGMRAWGFTRRNDGSLVECETIVEAMGQALRDVREFRGVPA